MKVISTAIATYAALTGTEPAIDVKGVEEFVGGLMFGLINKDDLPEIQKCLSNAEGLETEITEAVQDFEKKDIGDVIKGV